MKDAGDKLPADVKAGIEEKFEELKKVKDGEDDRQSKLRPRRFPTEIQKIGQAAYNKPNEPQGDHDGQQPDGPAEPKPDQSV